MKFFITADSNNEARLDQVLYAFDDEGFEQTFEPRFYDDLGIEIAVILMCRDPLWNFRQRIRFVKKENCLYTDLMLDLGVMRRLDLDARKRIIAEEFVTQLPQIVAKRKFKGFDLSRFSRDLREWFEQHGWIEPIFAEDEICRT